MVSVMQMVCVLCVWKWSRILDIQYMKAWMYFTQEACKVDWTECTKDCYIKEIDIVECVIVCNKHRIPLEIKFLFLY